MTRLLTIQLILSHDTLEERIKALRDKLDHTEMFSGSDLPLLVKLYTDPSAFTETEFRQLLERLETHLEKWWAKQSEGRDWGDFI